MRTVLFKAIGPGFMGPRIVWFEQKNVHGRPLYYRNSILIDIIILADIISKLLLADEPTGDLDSKTSQEIFDILKTLNEKDGVIIVVVTHDEKLGLQAKRVIHLQDGKVV